MKKKDITRKVSANTLKRIKNIKNKIDEIDNHLNTLINRRNEINAVLEAIRQTALENMGFDPEKYVVDDNTGEVKEKPVVNENKQ